MLKNTFFVVVGLFVTGTFFTNNAFAQKENNAAIAEAVNGLQFRSIGPALMGGRIADIAISSTDPSTWYVAAGSGNLWKTINSGITWHVAYGHWGTRQMPTKTYQDNLEIATQDFEQLRKDLILYFGELEVYEASLTLIGAPYTRGRK